MMTSHAKLRLVHDADAGDDPRTFALKKLAVALEALALPDPRPVDRNIVADLKGVAVKALAT